KKMTQGWFVPGALVFAGSVAVLAAGCAVAVAPASSSFHGGDPAYVRTALAKAGQAQGGPVNATQRPMAFIVLTRGGAPELWAYDFDSKSVRWNQSVDLDGRVAVARPVVVHGTRTGALVARAIDKGGVKWQASLGGGKVRVGYAAGGDIVAEVVQKGAGD